MQTIQYLLPKPFTLPRLCLPYFSGCSLGAFDIETTGLSPRKDTVSLIGVLSCEEEFCRITQFFIDDPAEEPALLEAFFSFCRLRDVLFHYNGGAFDLPFLEKRAQAWGLSPLPRCKGFDLFRAARLSLLSHMLSDLKLTSLEAFAGFHRTDTLSGKDWAALYRRYLQAPDPGVLERLLLHNREDLACFPALSSLARKIDLHRVLFRLGFPVKAGRTVYYVQSIKRDKRGIQAEGAVLHGDGPQNHYLEDLTFLVDEKGRFYLGLFEDREPLPQDWRQLNLLIIRHLKALSSP